VPDSHPLDPLTAAELERAVAAVCEDGQVPAPVRFATVELAEPAKSELAAWEGGGPAPARVAFAVVLDAAGAGFEARVDLSAGGGVELAELPGLQPAITLDEYEEAGDAARADPRFREALARRGIADPSEVIVDAWSVGSFEPSDRRLARGLVWMRGDGPGANPYAQPVGGLLVIVDLVRMEVVRVDDHFVLPLPDGAGGDYRAGGGRPYRDDLRPIEIVQPDGPSFTLEGNLLRWQNWRLRVGYSAREGLVLHRIAYRDGERERSICHRASIAELVIPYGDPNPTVHFKNAFDIGEYGIGGLANALELGCDCLGEIRYLDAHVCDSRGRVTRIANAICIHEEDAGLLWKHVDYRNERTDLARARRLVVSCIVTVGNYEYGFYWYLHQDGRIGFEGKLTGVLHTAGVALDEPQTHATLVAPGVAASYHQHFFTARLDLDVDGAQNVAVETESVPDAPGPGNPDLSAFHVRRTEIAREGEAGRDLDQSRARRFRVENPGVRNRMGEPVAYELVPGDNVAPLAHPQAQVRRRARYLDHPVWFTRYRPDQRYPGGEYPNQHDGGDGITRWVEADAPLAGEDVVLWYTFGSHHVPRLEDWPVMPVASCGFELRPVGFFDRNPALDVPPPAPHCRHA
jgi:primary-amine oxidase